MNPTALIIILLFGILAGINAVNRTDSFDVWLRRMRERESAADRRQMISSTKVYVVAPNSLRLNSDETLGIATDDIAGLVRVYVQDHPGKRKNITEKLLSVTRGKPELFPIRLEPQNFPPGFLTSSKPVKLVSVNVQASGFQKEILIPINAQSGYVFIQTDKPIYTPEEYVSIRIIPLDEDSRPLYELMRLQIRNPNGSIIEQRDLNPHKDRKTAFVTQIYHFPRPHPVLGEWSAVVYHGFNLTQNSTVRFDLREYVLPFFAVELQTPDVILPVDETIRIEVSAKYSYGKTISGFVSFRFGVKKINGEIVLLGTYPTPQKIVGGLLKQDLAISTLIAEKGLNFEEIENCRLYVEAAVVDFATGIKEKVIDDSSIFSRSPYDISIKRCLKDFKPGFSTVVEADVTYKNRQPADGIPMQIKAVADNTHALVIANNLTNTNENGQVSFQIHPEITHKTVRVTLQVMDRNIMAACGSACKIDFDLQASENNTYITLARISPQRLKPGDDFGRRIDFQPLGIRNIYFLVVARGKILLMDKLPEGEFKAQKVSFKITYEMVPSFRVLVFVQHRYKLLADSLKIEVEKVCNPNATVTIDTELGVKEPGESATIIIEGEKGTSVGLLAVDEAVYALSKKDLLTKSKIFNRLASHDLGCGPGSGGAINSVLGNAGIIIATNAFSPTAVDSCFEHKRKKRAVFVEMVHNYTGIDYHCCKLGMEIDPMGRDCHQRKVVVDSYLTEDEYLNCSIAFFECCKHSEHVLEMFPVSPSFFGIGKSRDTGPPELEFVAEKDEATVERENHPRTDFRETWLNYDFIIGPTNREEKSFTLPQSITTGVIQAVSLSPMYGVCVAEPKKLVVFKKIFLHLDLPYSAVRNEQIEIRATVFNYDSKDIAATIYMYGADGLCASAQPNTRSERKQIVIKKESSETVNFPVIPLKAQNLDIKVAVLSQSGSDIVQKTLRVIPEGVTKVLTIPVRLDPRNQQKREQRIIETPPYLTDKLDPTQNIQVTTVKLCTPENFVPGTESCIIKAIGDEYGPAVDMTIDNPDDLLVEPRGCGEQNMIRLAPTLYTMRYLKISGKMTADIEDKGYQYIRKGYANQLKYRKEDGSYAAFTHRNTSTWLTAFVIKVFCQASELVYIDEDVMCSGVRWLVDHQQPNGSFVENYVLYEPELMGGLDGIAPMTAFVLIALEECKCDAGRLFLVKNRAISYLEDHLSSAKTPLAAAIIAYALALSNSEFKQAANTKLLSMSIADRGRNWLYWKTNNSAQDVQTAGYAILTQLLLDDMEKSTSIVNWLDTQRLESGSYKSTQDTVVALQAMSEYSIRAQMPSVNLKTNIISSNDFDLNRTLEFNDHNARVLRDVKINKVGGTLFIKTSGNGTGFLSVTLRYNVIVPPEEICKFDIKVNLTSRRDEDVLDGLKNKLNDTRNIEAKSTDRKLRYNIELCVRYLGRTDTAMSIVDVGIFTGFIPVEEDLLEIVRNNSQLIQRYDITTGSVVFYLTKIPTSYDYCFSFHVRREFIVGNTQMSPIKVYDYYNPDARCTKFYKPERDSPILRTICTHGVCQCAEGGCPPRNPFSEIRNLPDERRRELLLNSLCDKYKYENSNNEPWFVFPSSCQTYEWSAVCCDTRLRELRVLKIFPVANGSSLSAVWKGRLSRAIIKEGGFLNISFLVQDVIKPGIEKREDVEGETRILLARDYCPELYQGVDYLILGEDGERYMTEDGVPWYRYLLNDLNVVHLWTSPREAANLQLQRDFNYVTRTLKRDGCSQ